MYEAIKNFHKQFLYQPEVINQEKLIKKSGFVVVGMGGSALAAKLLKVWKPEMDIIVRTDYGLPEMPEGELQNKLIILSSYSGNTEETIDAFQKAKEKNLAMAAVGVGGVLISLAKENNVPYIQLPDTGIQPRSALGFSLRGILKLIGEEGELGKTGELATALISEEYEKKGKELALKIKNHVPVIYASNHNSTLAYVWKIKFNETGKTPSFCNFFPELNHNEINSFDVKDSNKELCSKFHFIVLRDKNDHPKVLKRMEALEKLYKDRSLSVETIELGGENIWQKIFSSLILSDWTAYYTALGYGLDPDQVPIVEEFKKLISE